MIARDPVPGPFRLHARFDRPVCDAAGGRRHLILDLVPPAAEEVVDRRPLDLVLVVDASGSMAGSKLEAVRSSLTQVAGSLCATDRVSLVSFASDVRVHASALQLDAAGRMRLRSEAAGLAPRGSTNLSGGWLTGVELALSQGAAPRRRALVLLSDGHANEGVVAPEQLNALAAESARRGVATTSVGVGGGYSTVQMGVVSDASGGRFHHADSPEAIVEVVAGELGELAAVAAEQLELRIEVPHGFGVQVLSGASGRHVDGSHRVQVGAAYRGATRTIVVAIDAPPRGAGYEQELRVTLAGRDAGGAPLELATAARLLFGDARGVEPAAADALIVAQAVSAWISQQALNHNESGDFDAVRRLARTHAGLLHDLAQCAPQAGAIVHALEDMLAQAERSMDPVARKGRYVQSRKALYQERDLRSNDRS